MALHNKGTLLPRYSIMTGDDPGPDDGNGNVSRRGILGLLSAGAALGVGSVYGLTQTTGTAEASSHVDFEGGTITLEEDEELDSITLEGTASAEYDISGIDDQAASAVMYVNAGTAEGLAGVNGDESFSYDTVDPMSDAFSEDVSISIPLTDEVADPAPGEELTTEFFVTVGFSVDNQNDQEVIEAGLSSTYANLTVRRREAQTSDGGGTESGEAANQESNTIEASTSGSFHFVEADDG
ncbi:hypothetical protein HWV23_03595 [Natronomonas halophila]|uniref:hypothetical protein n=1 Tax=Natronomonas halophila TaxID=2747817 RepID=UPI0015B6480C|nr:hypothetical protein [Natronomonas halophila]QLD84836.1 hypothetical protein HWV23_03595 [Natronomonas halophila]